MADDDKKPDVKPTDDNKPADPAPPKLPADVARTKIKHPHVIELEKRLTEQQDKLDLLDEKLTGINDFLESAGIGGPKDVPVKHKKTDDVLPAANGGIFDEINQLLFGPRK